MVAVFGDGSFKGKKEGNGKHHTLQDTEHSGIRINDEVSFSWSTFFIFTAQYFVQMLHLLNYLSFID